MYEFAFGPLISYLGVVELHWVISGERHYQALLMELQQWILVIFQEETVVAKRRHGDRDLGQVVQILQDRALWDTEIYSVYSMCWMSSKLVWKISTLNMAENCLLQKEVTGFDLGDEM